MRADRWAVPLIAAFFIASGLGLVNYKTRHLGFSLRPDRTREVWSLEAEIRFQADGGPVTLSLATPDTASGFSLIGERASAPGFGLRFQERNGGVRKAVWTRAEAQALHSLYYRAYLSPDLQSRPANGPPPAEAPEPEEIPFLEGSRLEAAQAVVTWAQARAADAASLTYFLHQRLTRESDSLTPLQATQAQNLNEQLTWMRHLLAMAGVPARLARGVPLQDGRRLQQVIPFLEVWDGQAWQIFDLRPGEFAMPEDVFLWTRQGLPLVELHGGRDADVRFSVLREFRPANLLALEQARDHVPAVVDFSLHGLPIQEQNVFRGLLLIPVGALVLVLMRNLGGVVTAGTFMPVLLAMAFLETRLLPGLALFVVVVSLGLGIRSFLSHMNLLLVPRISAVVIVVILLMFTLALISARFHYIQGLSVTFFPMIILAWTIERLSILWEESGGHEAFRQCAGSLGVAVAAYLVMDAATVRHLIYSFPELILVVLGLILLAGRYTGYRLNELIRFAPFREIPAP